MRIMCGNDCRRLSKDGPISRSGPFFSVSSGVSGYYLADYMDLRYSTRSLDCLSVSPNEKCLL
jgi:hypothetical protein